MSKACLYDFSLQKIEKMMTEIGQPKFRAGQLYKWINRGESVENMSDLGAPLKEYLKANFVIPPAEILKELTSKDGTKKFLLKLSDGCLVECVLMNYKYGNTLCISTQVGCGMGCVFCASGLGGLERDLSAGEILSQVIVINKHIGGGLGEERKITNVVLMGSGEPLDNYDSVTKFLRLVNDENGLGISGRNISLSTSGIAPKIKQLADDGFSVTLTISLHSATNTERQKIMPVAKKYPLNELINAAKYYFEKTGRRVIFEYTLISGKNHFNTNADEIAALLKGFPAHVNLILLNKVDEIDLNPVTRKEAEEFAVKLKNRGISATIRRQMGADIDGACGQLRAKFVACKNPANSGQKD